MTSDPTIAHTWQLHVNDTLQQHLVCWYMDWCVKWCLNNILMNQIELRNNKHSNKQWNNNNNNTPPIGSSSNTSRCVCVCVIWCVLMIQQHYWSMCAMCWTYWLIVEATMTHDDDVTTTHRVMGVDVACVNDSCWSRWWSSWCMTYRMLFDMMMMYWLL